MQTIKTKAHFLPTYFAQPKHPITISLIGVGGTGSLLLGRLARLHMMLIQLGHPGIYVKAYDNDTFEQHNVGRQLCTPLDIGRNKATAMIEKINLNFGLGWEAKEENIDLYADNQHAYFEHSTNIFITCVDDAEFRNSFNRFKHNTEERVENIDFRTAFYWLDCGNGKNFGQIVLSTLCYIEQPKTHKYKTKKSLKSVIDIYGDMTKHDTKEVQQTNGCSITTMLQEQDVFVNDLASVFAINIIKKLFLNIFIEEQGIIFNDTQSLPIKL